jgi:hypothetical protein
MRAIDSPPIKPLNSRFYGEKSNFSSFLINTPTTFPESGSGKYFQKNFFHIYLLQFFVLIGVLLIKAVNTLQPNQNFLIIQSNTQLMCYSKSWRVLVAIIGLTLPSSSSNLTLIFSLFSLVSYKGLLDRGKRFKELFLR